MQELEEYVINRFPKRFKDKPILITEKESCYIIKEGKDINPIIISKNFNK